MVKKIEIDIHIHMAYVYFALELSIAYICYCSTSLYALFTDNPQIIEDKILGFCA